MRLAIVVESLLHSMMSVLPNGGLQDRSHPSACRAALDDVSATEWREIPVFHRVQIRAALDDVSATEWREIPVFHRVQIRAALDDVSATEWRTEQEKGRNMRRSWRCTR